MSFWKDPPEWPPLRTKIHVHGGRRAFRRSLERRLAGEATMAVNNARSWPHRLARWLPRLIAAKVPDNVIERLTGVKIQREEPTE